MAIKKEFLHYSLDNSPVYRFTIPNQTGDFVELTNQGGVLSGIYVHKPDGTMENISSSLLNNKPQIKTLPIGSLWGGTLGKTLADKLWSVADETDNGVFLTCTCLSNESEYRIDMQLGMNITWVNLNRLIIDYFITPKENATIKFSSNLDITNTDRTFLLRSFCPKVLSKDGTEYGIEETFYKDMSFSPIENDIRFINVSEDIKPMVELSDETSKLRISVYSTVSATQAEILSCNVLSLKCSEISGVELNAGETLANRVIFGFDYIQDAIPDDSEPSPFSFFL